MFHPGVYKVKILSFSVEPEFLFAIIAYGFMLSNWFRFNKDIGRKKDPNFFEFEFIEQGRFGFRKYL